MPATDHDSVPPSDQSRLITRSRLGDAALFATLLIVLVLISHRWRVYYTVNVIELSLSRVDAQGDHTALALPDEFRSLPQSLTRVQDKIRDYMATAPAEVEDPSSYFQWVIQYGVNSRRLDKRITLSFNPDGSERL